MNWKLWLKGLAAAAIGGAASGATQALSTNGNVDTATGMTAAAGAESEPLAPEQPLARKQAIETRSAG